MVKNIYPIQNFFMERKNVMFFLYLEDVANKRLRVYDIQKRVPVTRPKARFLLAILHHHGFLDYINENPTKFTLTQRYFQYKPFVCRFAGMLERDGFWKGVGKVCQKDSGANQEVV